MKREDIQEIIQLVERKIGLKPNSVSSLIWDWVVTERMNRCHIYTVKEYLQLLNTSASELQELVELVVIPETWFFRDGGSFDFLAYFMKHRWPSVNKSIKILSIPCSTGEEPYSIAITLLELGLPHLQIKIDAGDISNKALIRAKAGIYGKNSFRGEDQHYHRQYFEKIDEGYRVDKSIKDLVTFHPCNILSNQVPFEDASYSFIFCRNLLIYLDELSQQKVFALIQRLLAPNGFLVVGPAEAQLVRNAGFIPDLFPFAYAFSLLPSLTTEVSKGFESFSQSDFEQLIDEMKQTQQKSLQLKKEARVPIRESEQVMDKNLWISKVQELADSGNFKDAEKSCIAYLNKYGVHPHVYYLLGLIYHARGSEQQAEEFFQKTIYLQPDHYEALIYLALLTEKKGEWQKAELFHQRAKKVYK